MPAPPARGPCPAPPDPPAGPAFEGEPRSGDRRESVPPVRDFHATLLHLLGIDHEKLTYRYSGRDFRLTDVYGNVVKEVLA